MRVRNVLFSIIAVAGVDGDLATAQDTSAFVVDGSPAEWGGLSGGNEWQDVVPDTNSTVDILAYGYGYGEYWRDGSPEEKDELFAFIFEFLAPPFQGSEEMTVELFFDVSLDPTFGKLTGPWPDFRPDYCIGLTGQGGRLTTEFHRRYVGGQWETTSGADITEVEVALSGRYLEGAIPWSALGNPEAPTDPNKYLPFNYAFQATKGTYRDYVPNTETGVFMDSITLVAPQSWGRIKQR